MAGICVRGVHRVDVDVWMCMGADEDVSGWVWICLWACRCVCECSFMLGYGKSTIRKINGSLRRG